ncbi:MAG: class I SAM-dependent methyltransferase [Acetobacteraceae bacterium]
MIAPAPPLAAAISRTVRRYRGASRFGRFYVAGKLRLDPLYQALFALPAPRFGTVIDLGCGRGQLGILLLEAGAATTVLAVDGQAALLADARQVSDGLNLRTERYDLTALPALPAADTIFMIDVLYQLDAATQQAVLEAATTAARRRIIIRAADPARGWRSRLTGGLERMVRRVWPHAGAHVNPRPVGAIVDRLEAAGFSVSIRPCWQGTPFSNVLIDAIRRDTTDDHPAAT